MDCLPPASIAEATVAAGQKKSSLSVAHLIILGMLAGAYIGFGAQLYSLVTSDLPQFVGFGLTRLIGGLSFSVGLVLVVLGGAELFTGNSLIAVAAFSGRVSWRSVARNWVWVYVANIAGSLLLALVLFGARQYAMNGDQVGVSALKIAVAKVNMPFWAAFLRGVLCNWLVCLAVWMATGATDTAGKILAVILPVTAFVASGLEHSIANMFFIPMGLMVKNVASVVAVAGPLPGIERLTWSGGLIVRNLLPVTAGNIIGGVLFVACAYWAAYLLPSSGKGR
ncbi:MAG: formate/nitrite transporter family protein [Candidatus Cryosericum sp.]